VTFGNPTLKATYGFLSTTHYGVTERSLITYISIPVYAYIATHMYGYSHV